MNLLQLIDIASCYASLTLPQRALVHDLVYWGMWDSATAKYTVNMIPLLDLPIIAKFFDNVKALGGENVQEILDTVKRIEEVMKPE